LYPALHNEFNINVQNNIYNASNKNIKKVFGTKQLYGPKQKLLVFPKFCIAIITNAKTDNNKYTNAGEHRFLKSLENLLKYFLAIYKIYK
jgi:hypothetical protein|tara:strand:- start:16869 stop:17138 length:270 start_codon:yes stop_codon:yes gene_type:complete